MRNGLLVLACAVAALVGACGGGGSAVDGRNADGGGEAASPTDVADTVGAAETGGAEARAETANDATGALDAAAPDATGDTAGSGATDGATGDAEAGATDGAGQDTTGSPDVSQDGALDVTDARFDVIEAGFDAPADRQCPLGAFPRDGGCMCQPDVPNVCADRCTDLQTDDDNCGVCGHSCGPTATCHQGACGAVPVNVVPPATGCGAIDLAVEGGRIFWTDKGHGQVSSMPVAGGPVTTISDAESSPTAIAVVGSTVFWVNADAKTIRRSIAGNAAGTLITSPTPIGGFVVSPDGTTLYFSTEAMILRMSTSGGIPLKIATEAGGGRPRALALEGNLLAFPNDITANVDVVTLDPGQIASCGAPDGNGGLIQFMCSSAARSQGGLLLDRIILRSGRAIWANLSSLETWMETGDGGSAPIRDTLVSVSSTITGFGATSTSVYVGESDPDGSGSGGGVSRALLGFGATPTRIARGQPDPRSFAFDATRVYWSTSTCAINATGL